METKPIRIGQISDLHARMAQPGSSQYVERRCRDALKLFHEALDRMAELEVDFLAITGDLVDIPDYIVNGNDYYDYNRAQWDKDIISDYRTIKAALDGTGIPYTVLPGNHDLPRLMWQVFDESANVLENLGYRIARFSDREWENHVPHRVDRERKLWESLLGDNDPRPQIHLQHYVVTPAKNEWYPHTYLEGEEITRRTVASGKVVLLLSGHYHAGTDLLTHGKTHFATARPLCEFPYTLRVFDIDCDVVKMQEIAMRSEALTAKKRVVFLDRDGVINPQPTYNSGPGEMRIVPGAAGAIRDLRRAGYAIVVITNQSCVGCGYVTEGTIPAVHDRMCQLLRDEGGEDAQPDAIFASMGAGDAAIVAKYVDQSDAKPATVLVDRAIKSLDLDRQGGFFVGDRASDIQCGLNAGMTPILVRTGFGREYEKKLAEDASRHSTVVDDVAGAANFILRIGQR